MIDINNLKALAERQPVKIWTRTKGRLPSMKGQSLMYSVEGPEGVSDYEDWGFTRKAADYIAAANPAVVLELIAEIERLRGITKFEEAVACVFDCLKMTAANTGCREWDNQLEDLAEEVIEYAPEYKKQWKDICAITRERDQLRVENEALRKDAERYRWQRNGAYCAATIEGYRIICEEPSPGPFADSASALDAAIDAAMAQEVKQ